MIFRSLAQCRGRCIGILLLAWVASGCSSGDAPPKLTYPVWDELKQLQSPEIMMPIDMPFSTKDMTGFKKGILSPRFAAAVEKFKESEPPQAFADDDRKTAKEEAVASFLKCIELAKSKGSDIDLKKSYEAGRDALRQVGQGR